MLFSLYQIVYIQIEIKWFFRVFHFLFIIAINWFILGINQLAIINGICYFIFIVILFYQLEISKKEDSFQMYRVIEDFQSLKSLINDILPMQIFIVQRNSQQQQQKSNNSNSNNQDSQGNQIPNNIIQDQIQDETNIKKEIKINIKKSSVDKESLNINGISTAVNSNKQENQQIQNQFNFQKRKESSQSGRMKAISTHKQQELQNLAINIIANKGTDPSRSPVRKSTQPDKMAIQIKNMNVEELNQMKIKQNNFQLQTQENEDNNITEHLQTNPPLINRYDDTIPQGSVYNQPSINRDINGLQSQQEQQFIQANPLKIAFANKLVLQDFHGNNFEDILKELTNIQIPITNKNNCNNAYSQNDQKRNSKKLNTETLQDTLLSKLYGNNPIKLNQLNPNSSIINNGQPSYVSAQRNIYNLQHNIINKGNMSNRKSPADNTNEIQANFAEELETQKNQQIFQRSEFVNNTGREFQNTLQIKQNPAAVNHNYSNNGLQNGSEIDYNSRAIAISERGGNPNQPNLTTHHVNQWNSINRLGNQTGINYGNESIHIHNDSAILNQSNIQQGQCPIQNYQNIYQTIINQNNLNNDSLNMYNYIPNSKINKVWEYLNCYFKRSSNIAFSSNQRRNNNISDIPSIPQQQQQSTQPQVEDKNYDIKLVECKWEGEESIMVIMNNINERLMRERLLQIEQYKDTMIDTISHNLKTPLNCILAPLESIKFILQEEKEKEEMIQKNNQLLKNKKVNLAKNKNEVNCLENKQDLNCDQIALQNRDQIELNSLILKNKQYLSEEIQKQVSMAINNCQLLLYMINDMIDYSEIIKGENQFNLNIDYFKLSYIINTLNNLFQDQMQSKKIEFKITSKIDLSESKLLHDQRRLLQILVNLISNSLKFTFKGKIELIIDTPSDENNINLGSMHMFQNNQISTGRYSNSPSSNKNKQLDTRSLQSNLLFKNCKNQEIIQSNNNLIDKLADKKKLFKKEKHIRFTVVDSGIGMSHQKLQKLKRMLFKKEIFNIQNSSGLGLTMCYSLIKQIGCQHTHLEIQSEENIGTKFSFTIQQFYRSQQQLAVLGNTKSKFQSASPQQKQSNFALSINTQSLSANTGFQKIQLNNLEIKEESVQTKISPLIKQDSKKLNLLPESVGSNQIILNSQQLLKNGKSSNTGLSKSPTYNFSNLHTKTTLENQNMIQKTLNTISNDEHILDMSTEEIQGINDINKVKVNNKTHSTNLNQKQNLNIQIISPQSTQKEILKEYKTTVSNIQNNNPNSSPTGNSVNQEINNNINHKSLNIQKQNSLVVNMNLSTTSKNTKSQKNQLGVQSLNQFSIASLGVKQEAQQKSRINLKESNSNYSNINQRYTMIFGKSVKSDGIENNQNDQEGNFGNDSIEDRVNSSSSSDQENQQNLHNSNIKQGKMNYLNERISYNAPDEDFVDVLNEQSLANKEIQENEIGLEIPKNQVDDLESKQSKFTNIQRKAFLTFGQSDFNQKLAQINQGLGSSFTIQQKERSKQQIVQDDKSQFQNSQDGEFSEPLSENVDKILTVKYNFQTISKLKESTTQNFTFDHVIENKNISHTVLLQEDQDNNLSDQELSNSNILPHLHTEQSIQQTLEMILESKHVLVVDDTIYNIISLKIFFRNVQNLNIEEAYNGRDALQKYQENAINGIFYDYIFMDIEMPIMDGLECIKHIREFETANSLKKSIIITVTAYEREQQEVILAGANALIAKPIQKDKFLQTLRILQLPNQ
ncbi:ATPase, histidine kinase-, DNA gyrase B (macronuclear) [Tetrahymena thermophila SB210]|uniref:histidine kinase n=1 Tax=Tetrahymena thermophila (strain SB210) TaxID=312017 RepID=I7LXQ2_TETTS|nr:ATPase, histidine kinase-, DNA gyrase B [Tetrahymena thermophila SB210]EAS05134.2 ATPase, histidine kinase-, DNA gyrase B [Tetrahymena thermophila SB210]|eukprot:XP_001025379.2 ATPase, histidine kinase-, DNA gyrase B [Tetrahymena thermophila SB210]